MNFLDKLLNSPRCKWKGVVMPWGSVHMIDLMRTQPDFECWSPQIFKFSSEYVAETDILMDKHILLHSLANNIVYEIVSRNSFSLSVSEIAQVKSNGELSVCGMHSVQVVGPNMFLRQKWLPKTKDSGVNVGRSLAGSQVILLSLKGKQGELKRKVFQVMGNRVYRARQIIGEEDDYCDQLQLMFDSDTRHILGTT